jgi:phospholipid-binding lipoprotein MlaA
MSSLLRAAALVGALLATTACAGRGGAKHDAAPDTAAVAPVDSAAHDPWEPLNRKTHGFNRVVDRAILKPAARTYVRVVPKRARRGVNNFFDNLQQPVVALNLLAQGRPAHSGRTVVRFLLNSTIGLGGLVDVASLGGAPHYQADFGQTFARWGWKRSRYLVLPLFGPSSLRDGFGRAINSRVSPINELTKRTSPAVGIFYGVTSRAAALPTDAFSENAEDDYILQRDVWFQRRECQIRDCTRDLPDYELPEELRDPAPADAPPP